MSLSNNQGNQDIKQKKCVYIRRYIHTASVTRESKADETEGDDVCVLSNILIHNFSRRCGITLRDEY